MKIYKGEDFLKRCNAEIDQQIYSVNALFSSQKGDVLITAPLPAKWSAKQCLEHLNLTLRFYLPKLETSISKAGTSKQTHFKHRSVNLRVIHKATTYSNLKKAPKFLKPKITGSSSIDEVMEFAVLMKRLQNQINLCADLNLCKGRVSFAKTPLIKFNIGELLL